MRKLINVVITSSIMIVVVMILRKFFGSRVKSGAICVLWALVAMRLLIPVQLFGNVVNVTDYLTKNVINLQSRDISSVNCSLKCAIVTPRREPFAHGS